MSKPLTRLAVTAAVVILMAPQALAVDYQIRVRSALQANLQHNAVDPLLSFLPAELAASLFDTDSGNYETQYLLAWLEVRGAVTFADRVSLVATLDSTAITWEYYGGPTGNADWTGGDSPAFDGLDVDEALEKVAFVREFYAEAVFGDRQEVHVSLGKRRTRTLNGFFYDDYGVTASGSWDFWSSGAYTALARAYVTLPHRYLPDTNVDLLLVGAEVILRDMLFESITVGGFWLRDRAEVIHDLLRQGHATDFLVDEQAAQGLHAYFADSPASAPLDLGTFYVEGTLDLQVGIFHGLVALQVGTGSFPAPPQERRDESTPRRTQGAGVAPVMRDVDFLGHLALGEVVFPIVRGLSINPFILAVSGLDLGGGDPGRFEVFCSLVPYVQGYATILLTGGFGELYSGRDQELIGMGTGGLSALGTSVSADLGDRVSLAHSVALLSSNRPGDSMFDLNYGVEWDNVLSVALWPGFLARLEVDLLFPGDTFPSQDPMVVGIAGVRGAF